MHHCASAAGDWRKLLDRAIWSRSWSLSSVHSLSQTSKGAYDPCSNSEGQDFAHVCTVSHRAGKIALQCQARPLDHFRGLHSNVMTISASAVVMTSCLQRWVSSAPCPKLAELQTLRPARQGASQPSCWCPAHTVRNTAISGISANM